MPYAIDRPPRFGPLPNSPVSARSRRGGQR